MPYRVQDNCVQVQKGGKWRELKCYNTHNEALDYLRALNANVGKEHKMDELEQKDDKAIGTKTDFEPYEQSQVGYTVQSVVAGAVCANCRWYRSDTTWRPCHIVENDPLPVVSGGYCDKWEIRTDVDSLLGDIQNALTMNMDMEAMPAHGQMSAKDILGQVWKQKSLTPLNDYVRSVFNPPLLPAVLSDSGFKSLDNNTWVAWFSNNFQDKEGEYFAEKGIETYVKRVNDGLLALPELWYYHVKGTRVGQANKLFHVGHFLIAYGSWDNATENKRVTHIQKWSKSHDIRLSHGFLYNPAHKAGRVYNDFATFEITLLDKGAEANPYTPFVSVKMNEVQNIMPVSEMQKKAVYDVLPKELADEIINGAESGGKALEQLGIAYKNVQDSADFTPGEKLILAAIGKISERQETTDKALADMMEKDPKKKKPGEKEDEEEKSYKDAIHLLQSFDSALTDLQTNQRNLKAAFDTFAQGGSRASKSGQTIIPDNDLQANHIHQKNYESGGQQMGLFQQMAIKGQASLTDAFPLADDIPLPPHIAANGKTE